MTTTLYWLRNDLRLADNPALFAAAESDVVLPVFIWDAHSHGEWCPGAASRWWLHHSLSRLAAEYQRIGSRLHIEQGDSSSVLMRLVDEYDVTSVVWNRRYEPATIEVDSAIKEALRQRDIEVRTFNAGLLFEPWEIARRDGRKDAPYRVFTAFWKACQQRGLPLHGGDNAPDMLPSPPADVEAVALDSLKLQPTIPWDVGLETSWQPGEAGALSRLDRFLGGAIDDYASCRDHPAIDGTSALSPHLHFGEISPHHIIRATQQLRIDPARNVRAAEAFERELGWREFAHHLLFHFPNTPHEVFNDRFTSFPWRRDYSRDLAAWQQGKTGIPLVDAGMRQLWHTGWMHNRVRMIVGSLLTKNLLIPWQEGAAWFWDTLVDADLANNSLGWQWIAGCGADAAPYFRIFNPVLQGEKFDPEGSYIKRWVPELADMPVKYIHRPWSAPAGTPGRNGVYAEPIVDLKGSRERALAAYGSA